jgi:hypothetical protein
MLNNRTGHSERKSRTMERGEEMTFDFTVPDPAFAEKYRDRLHTLLQGVLQSNLAALEKHDLKSTVVIRKGMAGDVVTASYDQLEKRKAKFLADFGTLQGFKE